MMSVLYMSLEIPRIDIPRRTIKRRKDTDDEYIER